MISLLEVALHVAQRRAEEGVDRQRASIAELERYREAPHEAKEEDQATKRTKVLFLAGLSHELRTPLTPVLTTIAQFEGVPGLPEELRNDVASFRRNVGLEARLIDDLLDITRLSRVEFNLAREVVDVLVALRAAFEIERAQAEAEGVSVSLSFQAGDRAGDGPAPDRRSTAIAPIRGSKSSPTPRRPENNIRASAGRGGRMPSAPWPDDPRKGTTVTGPTGRRSGGLFLGVTLEVACWLASGVGRPAGAQGPPAVPPAPSSLPGDYGRAAAISRLAMPFLYRDDGDHPGISPGLPPRGGRPMPGSPLDPGASGPGIGSSSGDVFLGGALDPRTGWPFVFRDHFAPRPERVERFWVVQTRDCRQVMGSDPRPGLKVLHFDDRGELVPRDPAEMLAQTVGRPVFIQVQGSLTTPDIALGGLMWSHSWLRENRALPEDAVVIAFDWPSQRVYRNDVQDINEKGRRAYVAGFHLASFLLDFPPGSLISLLGQSYGGRVVPAALHLLGGGSLDSQAHDPPVRLPGLRPDLRLRAIILEASTDHFWFNPGRRFDRSLLACEAMLNIYNRKDEALVLYPLLGRGGHHRAIGRVGLTQGDLDRLGPLAARYEEHDVHELLGREHTLLDAVANRQIARWMAPYLYAPDPGPAPPRPENEPIEPQRRMSLFRRVFDQDGRKSP